MDRRHTGARLIQVTGIAISSILSSVCYRLNVLRHHSLGFLLVCWEPIASRLRLLLLLIITSGLSSYIHSVKVIIERAANRSKIDLVVLVTEIALITSSIFDHVIRANLNRFLLIRLMSRYPQVNLSIEAIVLLVV